MIALSKARNFNPCDMDSHDDINSTGNAPNFFDSLLEFADYLKYAEEVDSISKKDLIDSSYSRLSIMIQRVVACDTGGSSMTVQSWRVVERREDD